MSVGISHGRPEGIKSCSRSQTPPFSLGLLTVRGAAAVWLCMLSSVRSDPPPALPPALMYPLPARPLTACLSPLRSRCCLFKIEIRPASCWLYSFRLLSLPRTRASPLKILGSSRYFLMLGQQCARVGRGHCSELSFLDGACQPGALWPGAEKWFRSHSSAVPLSAPTDGPWTPEIWGFTVWTHGSADYRLGPCWTCRLGVP